MTERRQWMKGQEEEFVSLSYVAQINGKNQLMTNPATGAAMTYDLSGNLTSDGAQSFNRYTYTQNDPVNFVDPSGLQESWNWCGPQYGSCINQGQGYTGHPFDYNFFHLPWGDAHVSEHIANGWLKYEAWLEGKRRELASRHDTETTGDCARFADRVAEIASRHNDVRGFVDELARTFIGVASSGVDVMRENANNSTGEYFSSTGFRDGLFDDIEDNQARHFMGGLIAGYNLGRIAGALVMNYNEDSRADLRVNEISIPLGANLTNPSPAREVQASRARDDIRYKVIPANPGFKALADMIRNQVCAQ